MCIGRRQSKGVWVDYGGLHGLIEPQLELRTWGVSQIIEFQRCIAELASVISYILLQILFHITWV